MQRRVGHTVIETVAAESAKFTAPIILIHGLWCSATAWRRFMGYFAHRGWTCHALTLRRRDAAVPHAEIGAVRFADYLNDVREVLTACEAPPVVIGHDLGGLLAVHLRAPTVRAVVALAPLVPRAVQGGGHPVAATLRARWAIRRSAPLPPPHGRWRVRTLGAATVDVRPDSSQVLRDLNLGPFEDLTACGVPTLLVSGGYDSVSPPAAVERLARAVGGAMHVIADGHHALPWEPGWQRCVSEIHRWLVQALGEPLLAMREDDEEAE
jgi:pimeloyl-ACP methyl ester carboxylesterase